MTATASEPIHLGTYPAAWNRVAAQEDGVRKDVAVVSRTAVATQPGRVRAVGRDEDVDVSSSMWSALLDGVVLLGVVWRDRAPSDQHGNRDTRSRLHSCSGSCDSR